jgi:hypothetical protein
MEVGTHDTPLVPDQGDGADARGPGSNELGLSDADLDAARQLAEFHRMLAAELGPQSRIRGLALRCAGHWSRLGAIPRNGLAEAQRRDRS